MWEAIRSNRRRSWWLIAIMGVLLVCLGTAIGLVVIYPDGALLGAGIALLVWLVLWLITVSQGENILLSLAKARRIERADAPQLWNVVEEMTIASGLKSMPKVYIIDDKAPNAFAVGRRPERAALAVTAGLLKRLNRDELQGVIAHEIGHIHNLDVRFMTMASVMLGSIVLIADGFLRALWYGGGGRRSRSSSRGGGQAQLIILGVAVLLAILAPLCAQLLYFACSRRREYLADASAARFTRYPPGLAAALEKISRRAGQTKSTNRAVAPLYVVNPLQAKAKFSLFSTHPPTEKRVQILRSMGGRAGYADYEAAYRNVHGGKRGCIGAATLESNDSVAARAATPEPAAKQQAVERAREVTDLLDRIANLILIPCLCGVRIKVPPNLKRDTVACPRCGRAHAVPRVESATAKPGQAPRAMRYVRKGGGWESFKCSCGHGIQLSPIFSAPYLNCPKCRCRIEIVGSGSSS